MNEEFNSKYSYYKHIAYLATLVETDDESPEPDVDLMSESISELVEGSSLIIYSSDLVILYSDNASVYQDMDSLVAIAQRSNNDINALMSFVASLAMYADLLDAVQQREAVV